MSFMPEYWARSFPESNHISRIFEILYPQLQRGLTYLLSRHFGVARCVAAPAALIGASNFFELAVAAASSLFGV